MKHPKHDALSIPNLITYFRLALVPVFVMLYFEERYGAALVCLIVSGLSDVADGYIARHYNMVTDIGKVVDPLADKLTQAAMIFCVAWRHPILWALLGLLAVKEIGMLVWGIVALRRTGQVNSAKWYGKVCTAVLYASMAVMVLLPELSDGVRNIIFALCCAVMLMSLILYSRWYILYLREHGALPPRRTLQHHVLRSHSSVVVMEVALVVLLACSVLAILYRKNLTVAGIVSFTPRNLWLAALVFMALYAVKSATVVVYVKLLYMAAGIIFPLPAAIAVNIVGSVIELSLPYLLGRVGGREMADFVLQRRPALRRAAALRQKNSFIYCFLLRAVGVVPVDPMSIYLGACGTPYLPFLAGSLAGVLPTLVICSVFGDAIQTPGSPVFIASAVLFVAVQAAAAVIFFLWIRKAKETDTSESSQ